MKARNAIAAAIGTVTLAGGAAAMAVSSADAATAHPAASAGSSYCISFSSPDRPGVNIRAGRSTGSAYVGTASEYKAYTTAPCQDRSGSWYTACGKRSDMWEPVKLHGRWYWSAASCWVEDASLQ